jgi:hypothetical protein
MMVVREESDRRDPDLGRDDVARTRSRAAATVLVVLSALVASVVAVLTAGAPASAVITPKPLLSGVLDRNGPPPDSLRDVVDAYVVQVTWSKLQPTRHSFRTRALDRAFRQARHSGSRVKLRVLAGVHAPGWAKRLGGAPVSMRDPHDGQRGTVPRFWTASFGSAYADLQRRLASRYDDRPVLAEVVISRCTTFYAEPFVRQTSDRASRKALRRAGYTVARDKRCHHQEVAAHRVWKRTRAGLALNPAQFVTRGGGRTVDTGFTIAMMRSCRNTLGRRCVLENNSIRSPIASLGDQYHRMYAAMARRAPTLGFQTATAERIGSCADTLDWAADRGASYVEIPWNADEAGCTRQVLSEFSRQVD